MRGVSANWLLYLVLPFVAGSLIGLFVLFPVNEFADYYEHPKYVLDHYGEISVGRFVLERFAEATRGELPLKVISFVSVGALMGLFAGAFYGALGRHKRKIEQLQSALEKDVATLISGGENNRVEFKSSLRWDLKKGERNRAMEGVILKTLAGFMNAEGGTLLIGVADDGTIVGIEHDYPTLKKKDRDGFEVTLMTLVAHNLGAANCQAVHPVFHELAGKVICRVIVAPAPHPVYVTHQGARKFYLRTGGSTRELDIEQAVDFIATRWP